MQETTIFHGRSFAYGIILFASMSGVITAWFMAAIPLGIVLDLIRHNKDKQ